MAKYQPDAFQRAFSRRELFQGASLRGVLWSALGSVLLCLLLIDLFLIADLLDTRGRLLVPESQSESLARYTVREGLPTTISREDGPERARLFEDGGILPTVWRTRDAYWNPPLALLYRKVGWARENSRALTLLVLAGVLLGVLRGLAATRARRLSEQAGLDVAMRLRRGLHRQTLRLGPSDVEERRNELVYGLFTTDTDRIRDAVSAWVYCLGAYPLRLALLLWLALSIHWLLTLQCLIPLAFCWYVAHRQTRRTGTARERAQSRADAELRNLADSLRKTRLVRGYGMEAFEHDQFQRHLDRFRDSILAVQREDRLARWLARLAVFLGLALVLFLAGVKAIQPAEVRHSLALSELLLLAATFFGMWLPLQRLARLRGDRADAAHASDRIHRYLDRIPEVGQAVGAKFLQPLSRSVQFDSVSYGLPGQRVLLDRLDLKLPAGGSYAVISLDPLEPRALAYLLPRFIEPQSGRILFDGEDAAWATLESLRAETIYVGGSDPVFTGTVRENITCGDPKYTVQDATEAAKQMHANKFVLRLPQGYETVLGEHGEHLDAGQSFRIGLARAVLRQPALMIVEEPTDPLDDDTKAALDDAYTRLSQGRTVLFIPSRLSTVRRCDRVVLLHRGKVEAFGPHADLVRSSPLYRHWEYVRFNQFRDEE